jgi:hypothetical protein
MSITFSIPGLPDPTAFSVTRGGPPGTDSTPTTDLLDDVEVRHAFSLSPAARAQEEEELAAFGLVLELFNHAIVERRAALQAGTLEPARGAVGGHSLTSRR